MTTITTPPVAPPLERLYAEDEAAHSGTMDSAAAYWNSFSDEDRVRVMHSRTDYRDFYSRMRDVPLAVSRDTGRLLYLLARSIGARVIVEFGTSALCLAAALRDNGGGQLVTTEFEPGKVARAKDNLAAGGSADLVEFREGDALETLTQDCRKRSTCCGSTAPRRSIPRS